VAWKADFDFANMDSFCVFGAKKFCLNVECVKWRTVGFEACGSCRSVAVMANGRRKAKVIVDMMNPKL